MSNTHCNSLSPCSYERHLRRAEDIVKCALGDLRAGTENPKRAVVAIRTAAMRLALVFDPLPPAPADTKETTP